MVALTIVSDLSTLLDSLPVLLMPGARFRKSSQALRPESAPEDTADMEVEETMAWGVATDMAVEAHRRLSRFPALRSDLSLDVVVRPSATCRTAVVPALLLPLPLRTTTLPQELLQSLEMTAPLSAPRPLSTRLSTTWHPEAHTVAADSRTPLLSP